jgi:uncharacterized protein YxeA
MKKVLFILIALMIFIAIVLAAAGCAKQVKPQSFNDLVKVKLMYSQSMPSINVYLITHTVGHNEFNFVLVQTGRGVTMEREW